MTSHDKDQSDDDHAVCVTATQLKCKVDAGDVLSRRNRLLQAENESLRQQVQELTAFRLQHFKLHSANDAHQETIRDLQHENERLQHDKDALHQQVQLYQAESASLQQHQDTVQQLAQNIRELQSENQCLQEDISRAERVHSSKLDTLQHDVDAYQLRYNQLLQRYSAMEHLMEDYCDTANEDTGEQLEATQTLLLQWTHLLHHKQQAMAADIETRVQHGLSDMQSQLQRNTQQMQRTEHELAHTVSRSLLHDMLDNAVQGSRERSLSQCAHALRRQQETLAQEQSAVANTQRLLESQRTQFDGQQEIIASLTQQLREREHQNRRLTLQLDQLRLISQASSACNRDANVQQIEVLSKQLMQKELACDELRQLLECSEQQKLAATQKLEDKLATAQAQLHALRLEYQQLDVEYAELQKLHTQLRAQQEQQLQQHAMEMQLNRQQVTQRLTSQGEQWRLKYEALQLQYQHCEEQGRVLASRCEQSHLMALKHEEYAQSVHSKYEQCRLEYDKLVTRANEYEQGYQRAQSELNGLRLKLATNEQQLLHAQGQIQMYKHQQSLQSQTTTATNKEAEKEKVVDALRQQIAEMEEQLFRGSNTRQELRAFIVAYQKEGQMKLNGSYRKFAFMKHLVMSTMHVLRQQATAVAKNECLQQQLMYLTQQLQQSQQQCVNENQENQPHNSNVQQQ